MASVSKREANTRSPWEVRYKVDGVHKSKAFRLKRDADEFARGVEDKVARGESLKTETALTVEGACEKFIRDAEDRLRDGRVGRNSFENYKKSIEKHIVPGLGKIPVRSLTPNQVEDWYKSMMRSGRLAPKTAKSHVQYLRQFLEYAIKKGERFTNPAPVALKELRGVVAAPIRTFTLDEIRDLMLAVENRAHWQHPVTYLRLKCFVHLAIFCGLRWGEICGLTISNIDVEAGAIRISNSLTRWDELKGPKTRAGHRVVPMPKHVTELLSRWTVLYYVTNERELLFRTDTGLMVRASNFHGAHWRPLLQRAGLPVIHFHALRHFAASWMVENGMSLPDVATILGHSKFDVTLQVYTHAINGGKRQFEAMQKLASRLIEHAAPLAIEGPQKLSQ